MMVFLGFVVHSTDADQSTDNVVCIGVIRIGTVVGGCIAGHVRSTVAGMIDPYVVTPDDRSIGALAK